MATITNYTNLQEEIADWTKRPDMTARIPGFIQFAEADMNARLRLRIMESIASLTLSAAASSVSLPADFLEPISLAYTTGETLQQISRDELDLMQDTALAAGQPLYYAYGATTVDFERASDSTYTLALRYVGKLSLETSGTNAVLSAAPFVYLYGAMMAYHTWNEDEKKAAQYAALYERQIMALQQGDVKSRGDAQVRTELASYLELGTFDINRG